MRGGGFVAGAHQVQTRVDEKHKLIWAAAAEAPETLPIAGPVYSGF
ncbi:hypothetical protein [Pseudogemmobacter sp. W21_MBD1_M6]